MRAIILSKESTYMRDTPMLVGVARGFKDFLWFRATSRS